MGGAERVIDQLNTMFTEGACTSLSLVRPRWTGRVANCRRILPANCGDDGVQVVDRHSVCIIHWGLGMWQRCLAIIMDATQAMALSIDPENDFDNEF